MTFSIALGLYLGVALHVCTEFVEEIKRRPETQDKVQTANMVNFGAFALMLCCLFWPLTLIWGMISISKED